MQDLKDDLPYLALLQQEFDTRGRMWRGAIKRGYELFGQRWAVEFDAMLATVMAEPGAIAAAAKGYGLFSLDSMRRQKEFEVTREYPNKSYAEAASEVYFNEAHMMEEYLPGLLLSHYLWPHHYRQLQFFDQAFAMPMSLDEGPVFAEVGVGTGLYSRRLLERSLDARGSGFDISPFSCRFAARHIVSIGQQSRYGMHEQDILARPITPVRWLVCVEVLEHLEDPVSFLKALKQALTPGGRAFITAALNAGHTDHIYLYRTGEDVWRHLEAAGFVLEQSFLGAAYAPPAAGVPVPLAAAFVVS